MELQIAGCNRTVGLKIGTLFDSYNLRFEARDSSLLTTKLAMWYFSVSSPCWTIANLETCSFIRFNNAFRKTLLRAAKRKTRKLTDYRKQLLSRALISSRIVLSHENENCGKWSQVMVFVVGPRQEDEERCRQHYKHMILRCISV